jgi:thiosulfate reductase/polysulfide reductase chain A
MQALERGATLITVDPRFSVPASKSRYWLPIKPGTDIALLLAWMNVLINEELYDKDYVAGYCSGFEQLAAQVQPYNPEWAYLETSLEAAQIRATMPWLRLRRRPWCIPGVMSPGMATIPSAAGPSPF